MEIELETLETNQSILGQSVIPVIDIHIYNQELKPAVQADAQGLILTSSDKFMLSNTL